MSEPDTKPLMQYLSFYSHGVDDKRRVQIPARWRPEEETTQLTIMIWPKHKAGTCLRVMPEHEFNRMVGEIDALPKGDHKDALRRYIGRESVQVTLDKAGRVVLPDDFAKAADIQDQALFVGCIKHFEIWNPKRHLGVKDVEAVIAPAAFDLMD